MLVAKGIKKNYGALQVLKGVDISIAAGEIVSIVGSSGAGKSTLLHILGTLDKADEGEIRMNGERIDLLTGKKLSAFRNRHTGFVFQFHHLLPEFTALENVCIPGWIAKRPAREVTSDAKVLLDRLGLSHRMDNKPAELSGGEQQRVAVARALLNKPSIIFADEPTGNLDSENARELHRLFFQLRDELGQTFLVVTHNEDLAAMSDRVVHMRDGLVLQAHSTISKPDPHS